MSTINFLLKKKLPRKATCTCPQILKKIERQRESRGEINFIPPSFNLCLFVVVHLAFVCICVSLRFLRSQEKILAN